jgi:hypothetical protein
MLGLPLAVALVAPRQQPTFSVRTEAVRVDVSVMRAGQPVVGLQASNFTVFDNGVAQTIDLVTYEQLPLDVALALDTSASVAGERLRRLVEASQAVLGGLRKGDRAGLLAFNHVLHLRIELTGDLERLRRPVAGLEGAGLTSLFDATFASLALARSSDRRGAVILFSDGYDTSSRWTPVQGDRRDLARDVRGDPRRTQAPLPDQLLSEGRRHEGMARRHRAPDVGTRAGEGQARLLPVMTTGSRRLNSFRHLVTAASIRASVCSGS